MASTTELETLIVRLVGDADNYLQMLKGAEAATVTTAATVDAQMKEIQTAFAPFNTSWTGFVQGADAAAAAVMKVDTAMRAMSTARGSGGFGNIFGGYMKEAEAVQEKFNTAMRQTRGTGAGGQFGNIWGGYITETEKAAETTHKAGVSIRNVQHIHHGLMIAMAGAGESPAIRLATQMGYIYILLKHQIDAAVVALFTLQGALIATAAAPVIAGMIVIGKEVIKVGEEAKKTAEDIKEAFAGATEGTVEFSRSIGQDVGARIRSKELEHLIELIQKYNVAIQNEQESSNVEGGIGTGLFGSESRRKDVLQFLEDQKKRVKEVQEFLDQIASNPEVAGVLNDRLIQAANKSLREQTESLRAEGLLTNQGAAGKRAYAEAAKVAARENISLAAAIARLGTAEQANLEIEARNKEVRDAAKAAYEEYQKGIEAAENSAAAALDEANARGMSADAAKKYLEIQRFAREQHISEAEAITALQDALAKLDVANKAAFSADVTNKLRDINYELARNVTAMQDGAAAAERLAFAQEQVKQHGGDVAETLKQVEAKMKDIQLGKAAVKLFEDTLTPLDKYRRQMKDLNELLGTGKVNQELYARGVAMARREVINAEAAVQRLDAAEFRGAEALARTINFLDRNRPDLGAGESARPAPQVNVSKAGGPDAGEKIDKTNQLLKDIRDAVKKPGGLILKALGF